MLDKYNTLEQLIKAASLDDANKQLEQYLQALGLNSYAYTYYDRYANSKCKIKYDTCSKCFRSWHDYYLASDFHDVDKTLQHSAEMMLPVFWDVKQQLVNAASRKEKLMRQESLSFGVEKGVCIPIHGPREDFSVLTLHQRKGEHCIDVNITNMSDIMIIAYHYYVAIKRLLVNQTASLPSSDFNLSRREWQCLNLIANNRSTEAIAVTLGISVRTVHFHMQNLIKKMGVSSKYQALFKAQNLNLL